MGWWLFFRTQKIRNYIRNINHKHVFLFCGFLYLGISIQSVTSAFSFEFLVVILPTILLISLAFSDHENKV